MTDDVIRFQCPCCRKKLQLDTGTREVKVVKFEQKTDGGEMDRLLSAQQRKEEQLGDAFSQAQRAESDRSNQFDDLFDNAVEDAKKHKDEKPNRPFDAD